jgi:hypothetical protein
VPGSESLPVTRIDNNKTFLELNDVGDSVNLLCDASNWLSISNNTKKLVTDTVEQLDVGFYYFGDPNINGTWRIGRDGNNLTYQRLESGTWVTKSSITP